MHLSNRRRFLKHYFVLAVRAAAGSPSGFHGAGATFPAPLYAKWAEEFSKISGIPVTYQSIGSLAGLRLLMQGAVDFSATDWPLGDANLIHIPVAIGAVVPVCNWKLDFTGPTLAKVFAGAIARWDDREIAISNPGIKLPPLPIKVVHRSDASASTLTFTNYLSKVSPAWKAQAGAGMSVNWPAGSAAKGGDGLPGAVRSTPGAISFLEAAVASLNEMPACRVKNRSGRFAEASLAGMEASAGALPVRADDWTDLIDAPGADSYPICTYTWLLIRSFSEPLKRFVLWALGPGQTYNARLLYGKVPDRIAGEIRRQLQTLSK